MGKRKKSDRDSEERILRKIKKLKDELDHRYKISPVRDRDIAMLRSSTMEENSADKENLPENPLTPEGLNKALAKNDSIDITSLPGVVILDKPCNSEDIIELPVELQSQELDEDTLKALGVDPEKNEPKELFLHETLVSHWYAYMADEFPKVTASQLLEKYPRKGNLLLEAPELNRGIAVVLNETGLKRDNLFVQEQNWTGSALAALGSAITSILRNEEEPLDRFKLLEQLADAGMCMTQVHRQISVARKAYIAPSLQKTTKELLHKTTPGVFLYGDKLSETIKTAKSVEKLGKEIKVHNPTPASSSSLGQRKPAPKYTGRQLNWKGPYPRQGNSYQGPRTGQQNSRAYRPQKGHSYQSPNNQSVQAKPKQARHDKN